MLIIGSVTRPQTTRSEVKIGIFSRPAAQTQRSGIKHAEVAVEVIESETGWSPTISLEDTYKLDDVRDALKAGDLKAAAKYGCVYELRPVISAQ